VLCPKDRKTELEMGQLAENLEGFHCADCQGTWIPAERYELWQAAQGEVIPDAQALPEVLEVDFVQSPYDTRAALCPECQHYLSRAKVGLEPSFYVERCKNCGGIWCDRGEWNILTRLGLSATIDRLFTSSWQEQVRQRELSIQERRALREKVGDEVAETVFDLAAILEQHPNGDFAVAYLMRRFSSAGPIQQSAP